MLSAMRVSFFLSSFVLLITIQRWLWNGIGCLALNIVFGFKAQFGEFCGGHACCCYCCVCGTRRLIHSALKRPTQRRPFKMCTILSCTYESGYANDIFFNDRTRNSTATVAATICLLLFVGNSF